MMMKRLSPIIIVAACAGFIASCTPPAARVAVSQVNPVRDGFPQQQTHQDSAYHGDTYTKDARRDAPSVEPEEEMTFFRQDDVALEEFDAVVRDSLAREGVVADPSDPRPVRGGRAEIYLPRGFIDDAFADMTRVNPFGAPPPSAVAGDVPRQGDVPQQADAASSGSRIFKVTDSTHRRLELTLTREVRRANGRKVTALDFVELWSQYMKSNPAQGLALFRNVQGAEGFVTGKDPVVNGFSAADENTIRIRLAKPDPLAFHRMNSPKLIGDQFMLGAYYTGGVKDARRRLLPNPNSLSAEPAYLQECIVHTGGDPAPLTKSFAEEKYTAVALYSAADLLAVRDGAHDGVTLHRLPADRYFLACRSDDPQARRYVRSIMNGAELIKIAAPAEGGAVDGEPIKSAATRDEAVSPPAAGSVSVPQLARSFRIIYRDDDPVSAKIAGRLAATLTAAGVRVNAVGGSAEAYERSLVAMSYDCAVGWVSETVLDSQTEQLHFASMWFADELDAKVRIGEYREIPLFSVNNYLLLRKGARLHEGRVGGIWVEQPAPDGQ